MLTEEDVESWNKLFPVCQISKTNLGNPSENFFSNALVGYLRRFGYNIDPPFNLYAESKENNKENRLFLIKLSRQIDHFLKITDKNYSFTYYDLIRPTPKKTAHVLYILLNYYYYYNVYKEDVFKMAGEKIHELEELKTIIDKTKYDYEHQEEENKNIKSAIKNLTEEVPMARARLKDWDKKRNLQYEEFQKLSHAHQELKEKLKHSEEHQKQLRKRVVTEGEFEDLQNQQRTLKLKLLEHKEMEVDTAANLNECKKSNANLQKISSEIEKAHKIISLHQIKAVQETNKQLVQTQKDERELKTRESTVLHEIEEQNVTKESLEQDEHATAVEFQTKLNKLRDTLTIKQSIVKQKNFELQRLEEKDHISECQLEEQKDISQYLHENIAEVLAAYDSD